MVIADSKCPKCGNGIMKLFAETKPLIPQPEQRDLRARCTVCKYEDTGPPLIGWGSIAHQTERLFRGLQIVFDAPVRPFPTWQKRTDWSESEEKTRTFQRDRYTVRWWFIETALGAVAVVLFPQPGSIVAVVFWIVSIWRIVDIVQLNVNKTVFDSLRTGIEYQQASTVRSLVLAVLNYLELLVCFGILYCLSPALLVDTALQTRPPIADAADAFYFSVVTQLTVGYGDIVPRGAGKLVAALQAILGFGFALIILGRVVNVLPPIVGMADRRRP